MVSGGRASIAVTSILRFCLCIYHADVASAWSLQPQMFPQLGTARFMAMRRTSTWRSAQGKDSKLILFYRPQSNEDGNPPPVIPIAHLNVTKNDATGTNSASEQNVGDGPSDTSNGSSSNDVVGMNSVDSNLLKADPKDGGDSNRGNGSFGDIMAPPSTDELALFRDGLVTSSMYSLSRMYGITDPLDRMALTANGNLQRLFSSYYDAPVSVVVDYCTLRGEEVVTTMHGPNGSCDSFRTTQVWDRQVHLQVYDQTICTAVSVIQVHDEQWQKLVQSGQVGIGQLFRHYDILPAFELQQAGKTLDGGFWRNYTLSVPDFITCSIQETFVPNVWTINFSEETRQ